MASERPIKGGGGLKTPVHEGFTRFINIIYDVQCKILGASWFLTWDILKIVGGIFNDQSWINNIVNDQLWITALLNDPSKSTPVLDY